MSKYNVICVRSEHVVHMHLDGTAEVKCISDSSAAAWTGQSDEGEIEIVLVQSPREAMIATGMPEQNILAIEEKCNDS